MIKSGQNARYTRSMSFALSFEQEMSFKKDKRRQIKKGRKYNTRLGTCT